MSSETERVALGATLLDTVKPLWFEEIDGTRLDLGSPRHCVAGQLFESYTDGMVELLDLAEGLGQSWNSYEEFMVAHGMETIDRSPFTFNFEYDRLTALWRREIAQRRVLALALS